MKMRSVGREGEIPTILFGYDEEIANGNVGCIVKTLKLVNPGKYMGVTNIGDFLVF